MAYVPVPKDLTKVKTKVMFNLTKRQLVCFGGGLLVGLPLFFLLMGPIGVSSAALCMMIVMLPCFLLAMYEKNGQPLEQVLGNLIRVSVLRPKQRPYKTKNYYTLLVRQERLDEEVSNIVRATQTPSGQAGRRTGRAGRPPSVPRTEKTDQGRRRPGRRPG